MLISASEIITTSFKLYKNNWQRMISYFVLLFLLSMAQVLLTFYFLPIDEFDVIKFFFNLSSVIQGGAESVNITYFLKITLFQIVFLVLNTLVTVPLLRDLADIYREKKLPKISEQFRHSLLLLLPGIEVSLLTGLITALGFLFLLVPGIIFSIWFAFSFHKVILDEVNIIESIKESKNLVSGRWWGVFWRLLAPSLAFGLLAYVVQRLLGVGLNFATESQLLFISLQNLISVLFVPLSVIATIILFIELKRNPVKNKKPHPHPEQQNDNLAAS
jgi:hypothetical protein